MPLQASRAARPRSHSHTSCTVYMLNEYVLKRKRRRSLTVSILICGINLGGISGFYEIFYNN